MGKHKFAEGGVTGDDLEAANASEDPIGALNKRKGWTETEEVSETVTPKKQSFKEAFAEARKGGGKTFEWNGKKYTTELASEKKSAPAPSSPAKPAAKYETPYDRMNRENRESASARSSAKDAERATLRKNIREGSSGRVNPKTLLPEAGLKKGGSVRGWGMARGARKAKIV